MAKLLKIDAQKFYVLLLAVNNLRETVQDTVGVYEENNKNTGWRIPIHIKFSKRFNTDIKET